MNRAVGFFVAAAVIGSACGTSGPPPLTPDQLLVQLRGLRGVTADIVPVEGLDSRFTHYVLHFTQPLNHDAPGQETFQQQVSLLHRNDQAPTPMIVCTSGYADTPEWGQQPGELTTLLDANQVSIEHRYYGTSLPTTTPIDWTYLSIAQMAHDEHEIIAALKTIYGGKFVSTGTSKGGMTAVIHRSFHHDDVDGTVAYVAPISLNAPDPRYDHAFDSVADTECGKAVHALAIKLLEHRKAIQETAEQDSGSTYTRVKLGAAVEAAIGTFEWSFWQQSGENGCASLPTPTADDDELFAYLEGISPVTEYNDKNVALYEAYTYQARSELGYPNMAASDLKEKLEYGPTDYLNELPMGTAPHYDNGAMRIVQSDVANNVGKLVFIYGEWDPWTKGGFPSGNAANRYTVGHGNHLVKIANLTQDRRDAALAEVADWTGVTPVVPRLHRTSSGLFAADKRRLVAEPHGPTVPPPLLTAAPR
jgi:hypothetical protein